MRASYLLNNDEEEKQNDNNFLTKTNCTNCEKQSTFERFDRVYAVKTPEIVSAILDWDLFKFTCHNCNHMVLIDYPTVVVDEEQKTIIQYDLFDIYKV